MRRRGFTPMELIFASVSTFLVVAIFLPGLLRSRSEARTDGCIDNFKHLALACHTYEDVWKSLPYMCGGTITDGGPMDPKSSDLSLSGWVALAPFMDQQEIYDGAARNNFGPVPWTRADHWDVQIPILLCPDDTSDEQETGDSNYKFVIGTTVINNNLAIGEMNGMFTMIGVDRMDHKVRQGDTIRFGEVNDGLSNTLMLSERRNGFDRPKSDMAWVAANVRDVHTKDLRIAYSACTDVALPVDSPQYDEGTELVEGIPGSRWCDGRPFYAGITTIVPPNGPSCSTGNRDSDSGVFTASSYHEGLVVGALGDASVRTFSDGVDIVAWWAIGTRDGEDDPRDILR